MRIEREDLPQPLRHASGERERGGRPDRLADERQVLEPFGFDESADSAEYSLRVVGRSEVLRRAPVARQINEMNAVVLGEGGRDALVVLELAADGVEQQQLGAAAEGGRTDLAPARRHHARAEHGHVSLTG